MQKKLTSPTGYLLMQKEGMYDTINIDMIQDVVCFRHSDGKRSICIVGQNSGAHDEGIIWKSSGFDEDVALDAYKNILQRIDEYKKYGL